MLRIEKTPEESEEGEWDPKDKESLVQKLKTGIGGEERLGGLTESTEELRTHDSKTCDWSAETKEKINDNLISLLEKRASYTIGDPPARLEQLRSAIQRLPEELDAALSAFEDHLVRLGVVSLEVYIVGGFAREAIGELITNDEDRRDTSIRPDTDVDVLVFCTMKDGVKVNPSKFPSPFSPVLDKLKGGDLKGVVDITFGTTTSPKIPQSDKPKILLWRKELLDTAE